MAVKLDDNAREALQFLMLGAAMVLVVRLVIGGVQMLPAEDPFLNDLVNGHRNGFLLLDAGSVVVGGLDLTGRLAVALAAALAGGLAGSLVGGALAYLMGRVPLATAVHGARAGMLLVLGFGVCSALFLPARVVQFLPAGIRVLERPALPGGLGLPLPANILLLHWNEIHEVDRRSVSISEGCGSREELLVLTPGGRQAIVSTTPSGRNCEEILRQVRAEQEQLALYVRGQLGPSTP
jgi:hypothetical protein